MRIRAVELPVAAPAGYADFVARVLPVVPAALMPVPGEAAVQHLAFTVPTGSFAAARDALERQVPLLGRGGRTLFEGPAGWNSRSVYFDGPDRHVLELIERRDLPAEPLAVSEVGVAVPDVLKAVAALHDAFGLAPFGTPSESFAAVGDQSGLLILAPAGRPWLPTLDRLAEPSAVVVRIDAPGREVRIGSARILGRDAAVSRARAAG